MVSSLRCAKCRFELLKDTTCQLAIIDVHEEAPDIELEAIECSSQTSMYFLKEGAISWIMDLISEANWTKGKLNCPSCDSRVGSFDFVSKTKCACGVAVLPAVHLVKSKVDSNALGSSPLAYLKSLQNI